MENNLDIFNLALPMKGNILYGMVLWTKVRPLKRPRESYRTPLQDQRLLFSELNKVEKQLNPIDKPVIVEIYFCFSKKGTELYPVGLQIGDIDNLCKAVLDGLVKYNFLKDDKFIVGLETYKMFDLDDYCIVNIYEVGNE